MGIRCMGQNGSARWNRIRKGETGYLQVSLCIHTPDLSTESVLAPPEEYVFGMRQQIP